MSVAAPSPRPKLLVVEDSYLTAETVCDMVVRCGWDVAGSVGQVESGVRFLRDHDIDGAVIDIDLQGSSSFPLCEQLRKRDIPFIFLTGYAPDYPVPKEFKATPWLLKPIDNRQFEVALAGLARTVASDSSRGNLLLDRLSAADWSELRLQLERVSLKAGDTLCDGGEVGHAYFPTSALVSITSRLAHGKSIEVGLVGREGMVGFEIALGRKVAAGTEAAVLTDGSAWRVAAEALMALGQARPSLREQLLGAVHGFVAELAENAAAVGTGTIEQRLARRLLRLSARLGSRQLAMTHDSLAKLMAVRRSGVTVALHMLESHGLIRSRRNLVEIVDYEGLVRVAGEGSAVLSRREPAEPPTR